MILICSVCRVPGKGTAHFHSKPHNSRRRTVRNAYCKGRDGFPRCPCHKSSISAYYFSGIFSTCPAVMVSDLSPLRALISL